MAAVIPVASADDPRLAGYTRLTDAEHRRAREDTEGTFVVEGVTAIRRALVSPYVVRSVLVTPAKHATLEPDLATSSADVYVVAQDVMNRVAGFDLHRGAVAVAERRPFTDLAAVATTVRRVAVLESLNDHENLGAVARSAAALGVEAFVLDPMCADPFYRRCVRVSMGEILHLELARADPWPDRLDLLRDGGFALVALTPDPLADPIDVVAARLGGQPVAVLLGAEGPGLTAPALAFVDHRARIPMRPGTDSLNVGHAAAIAFHVLR